jgi:hypothetical protein
MSIKGFSIGGVTQKYDYNSLDNIPRGEGLSEEAKQAILQIAEKVAYIDAQGQTYYDALHDAFYPPKTVVSITAVFDQGTTVIYDDTALNDLKQYLQVTARYDDNTTAILADSAYTLSGLLEAPSSTVTVLCNGVSTTFSVAVTARPTLSSITAVYTQSGTVYDTDTLDSLKADLVVTAHYSDSSTQTVPAADYTLYGTLTAGTSPITVSYGGKTDTFTCNVIGVTWLFKDGNECTDITGGWDLGSGFVFHANHVTAEKTNGLLSIVLNDLTQDAIAQSFSTHNAIDLSPFSTIVVECIAYKVNNTGSFNNWFYFPTTLTTATTQAGAYGSDYSSHRSYITGGGNNQTIRSISLDISSQSGSRYVSINCNPYDKVAPGAYLKVSKVYLVPNEE